MITCIAVTRLVAIMLVSSVFERRTSVCIPIAVATAPTVLVRTYVCEACIHEGWGQGPRSVHEGAHHASVELI